MPHMPMDAYSADYDMHMLKEAESIMANPKRLAAAKEAAKAKIAELQSFVGDKPADDADMARNGFRKV